MYLVNFLSYGRRYSLALLAGVLVVFTLQSCTAAETFNNSDSSVIPKTLGDVIEWRMTKDPSPEPIDIIVSNEWRVLTLNQLTTQFGWVMQPSYLTPVM